MKRAILILIILLGVVVAPLQAADATRDVTDDDIDRVIDEIKRWLWGQQKPDGSWHSWDTGVPTGTGHTAIALFALLESAADSGEMRDERIRKGVDWLAKQKLDNTYVIAMRTVILSQVLHDDPKLPYDAVFKKDVEYLTKNAKTIGAWGYKGPEKDGDNSCSQMALLALWEAERTGLFDIDTAVIRAAEASWMRRQRKDGGWTYSGMPNAASDPTNKTTASMTAAGLASLYVCQDMLTTAVTTTNSRRNMDNAFKCLGEILKDDFWKDGYLAFCVQRIGMASGAKFIGEKDWFALAAAELVKPTPKGRPFQGDYGKIVAASFELVFLARARQPLTFNKLDYGAEALWNTHGRDLPRFTDYMRRNYEQRLRWQVVKLADEVRLLLDAPILVVEGTAELRFSPEEVSKLREYTLRGGTLLFIANKSSVPFADSARKLLGEMYKPQQASAGSFYNLDKIPANHKTLYDQIKNPDQFPLEAVSDGSRYLAIISQQDLGAAWQGRNFKKNDQEFLLGANIFFTATGRNPLQSRLRPTFAASAAKPKHTAKIVRIKHDGNWDTQPHGLDVLSQMLSVGENKVALEIAAGECNSQTLKGCKLAWITGTKAFSLNDSQVAALRQMIDDGGLVFMNAIGGSAEFATSAKTLARQLSLGRESRSGEMSSGSDVVTGKIGDFRGPKIGQFLRTRAWMSAAKTATGLQMTLYTEADRPTILIADYGIHDTLDGHTSVDGISYMPKTAREIASNIVLLAMVQKPIGQAPAATAPASEPATAPATAPVGTK